MSTRRTPKYISEQHRAKAEILRCTVEVIRSHLEIITLPDTFELRQIIRQPEKTLRDINSIYQTKSQRLEREENAGKRQGTKRLLFPLRHNSIVGNVSSEAASGLRRFLF